MNKLRKKPPCQAKRMSEAECHGSWPQAFAAQLDAEICDEHRFRAEVEKLDRERAAARGDNGMSKTCPDTEEPIAESILRARGVRGVGADRVLPSFSRQLRVRQQRCCSRCSRKSMTEFSYLCSGGVASRSMSPKTKTAGPEARRGVGLIDHGAKIYLRFLRSQLAPGFESSATSGQFGGPARRSWRWLSTWAGPCGIAQ